MITDEEQKRLLRLGNLVLVDYVRSMIDLLSQSLDEAHNTIAEMGNKVRDLRQLKQTESSQMQGPVEPLVKRVADDSRSNFSYVGGESKRTSFYMNQTDRNWQ